jgi:hypothetical protein
MDLRCQNGMDACCRHMHKMGVQRVLGMVAVSMEGPKLSSNDIESILSCNNDQVFFYQNIFMSMGLAIHLKVTQKALSL